MNASIELKRWFIWFLIFFFFNHTIDANDQCVKQPRWQSSYLISSIYSFEFKLKLFEYNLDLKSCNDDCTTEKDTFCILKGREKNSERCVGRKNVYPIHTGHHWSHESKARSQVKYSCHEKRALWWSILGGSSFKTFLLRSSIRTSKKNILPLKETYF